MSEKQTSRGSLKDLKDKSLINDDPTNETPKESSTADDSNDDLPLTLKGALTLLKEERTEDSDTSPTKGEIKGFSSITDSLMNRFSSLGDYNSGESVPLHQEIQQEAAQVHDVSDTKRDNVLRELVEIIHGTPIPSSEFDLLKSMTLSDEWNHLIGSTLTILNPLR